MICAEYCLKCGKSSRQFLIRCKTPLKLLLKMLHLFSVLFEVYSLTPRSSRLDRIALLLHGPSHSRVCSLCALGLRTFVDFHPSCVPLQPIVPERVSSDLVLLIQVYERMASTSLFRSWWFGKATNPSPSDGATKPDGIKEIVTGVYNLSEPKPPSQVEVEIVFIHGLQLYERSDAYWTTWMGGKDCKEFCWPMEWLTRDFLGYRIWSLSYDSTAWKGSDKGNVDLYAAAETLLQGIVEHAHIGEHECPIVFVCHCLGGLMAKEIVKLAFEKRPKYENFLQRIRGFFYYSTPHHGLQSS